MEKIAYAYGINFKRIENIQNINEQISEVLKTEGPIICEVILDENQNFEPKLSSKVLPDGTMQSPELDDMFPFIDQEEYDKIKREVLEI